MLLFWECSEAGRVAGKKRSTTMIWSLPSKYKLCFNFCNTEIGKNGHLRIKTTDSSQCLPVSLSGDTAPPKPHPIVWISFHMVLPLLSLNKVSQHFTKIKRDCFPRQGPSATWMFPLVPTPSASPWHSKALFRKAARSPTEEGRGGLSVVGGGKKYKGLLTNPYWGCGLLGGREAGRLTWVESWENGAAIFSTGAWHYKGAANKGLLVEKRKDSGYNCQSVTWGYRRK